MRSTKSYGVVSCWQEHKMLVQAEHTFERKQKKKPTGQGTRSRQVYRLNR